MLMGVTTRHTRRILAAYREEGAAAVAHGHRGRQPPNATPDAVVADVVRLARARYAGANHTHLSELLRERAGIDIGRTTRRRILVNAGLSSPRLRRPPQRRVRRQRMPREGLLIQLDGRHHVVVGGPGAAFRVADRSGRCHRYGGRRLLLRAGGRPQLLPADPGSRAASRRTRRPLHRRHAVFRHTPGSGLPELPTQFRRAMAELGRQLIFARSPQARGRVERTAGTFQDRLVTELRLAGASRSGAANRVLEQFLSRFNRRCQVPPQHPEPAFRRWTRSCVWTGFGASNTAERWPRTTRCDSSCLPGSCCQVRNAPAVPRRRWRSWQDWTAGSRRGAKATLWLPRRRHPVRHCSATATGVPQLLLSRHPAPTAWANTGPRLSNRWTQGQRTSTATL